MSDGDTEQQLMSLPPSPFSSEGGGPVLESHDPSTGMGTFRMPDMSTMDVHLPSAGIVPHTSVPVMSSEPIPPMLVRRPPSTRVPVTPTSGVPLLTPSQVRDRDLALRSQHQAEEALSQGGIYPYASEEDMAYVQDEMSATQRQQEESARQARVHEFEQEEAQQLAELERHGIDSAPDEYGIITRTYGTPGTPSARTERMGPPGVFTAEFVEREQARIRATAEAEDRVRTAELARRGPSQAGILTLPSGRRIITDEVGNTHEEFGGPPPSRGVIPEDPRLTNPAGRVEPGNIPLHGRPIVQNPDGTYSTIRSISIGTDQGEVLIPTAIDGRVVSDEEAIQHYHETGQHLGIFRDVRSADRYADLIHTLGDEEVGPQARGEQAISRPSEELISQAPPMSYVAGTPRTYTQALSSRPESELMSVAPVESTMPATFVPAPRMPSRSQVTRGPSVPQRGTRGVSRGTGGGTPSTTISRAPVLQQTEVERQLGLAPQAPREYPPTSARLPRAATQADIERFTGQAPQREPDLIERQYNVEAKRQQLAGAAARQQLAVEQQTELQRQETERQRQGAVMRAQRGYQQAIDRVSEARVDPAHFWHQSGAPGMIGATIAVALGAIGNAFTGNSTNAALEQINRVVDQDIQAQQNAIGNLREAAGMQGNMVGIMRQEFSDREAANLAARSALLQQTALSVQEQEAHISDAEAQNHALQLRQQLESQAEEARQEAIATQSEVDLRNAQAQQALARGEEAMGQADYMAARTARLQRPGTGGGRRPHPITEPMINAANALMATGMDAAAASAMAGFPAGVVIGQSGAHTEHRESLDAISNILDSLQETAERGQQAGDIPGVGFMDSALPRWALTQEARTVRQQVLQAVDLIGRLRSGAVINQEEADRFIAILGAAPGQTEDEFINGLAIIRSELGARLNYRGRGTAPTERDVQATAPGARRIEE